MITYDKSFWGFALLGRLYGSAFPRALPATVFSAVFTLVLTSLKHHEIEGMWIHPFPYQAFAFIVGFILVFRTQYGYQRYWEGCSQFCQMSSRWVDATTMVLTFDRHTLKDAGSISEDQKSKRFQMLFIHLMSLMHATACQGLRRDPDLRNLTRHSSKDPSPPPDPRNLDRKGMKARNKELDATVGQWNSWKDFFMLRASQGHLGKFNSAFPLPVIGHISSEEADALACYSDVNKRADNVAHSCCANHVLYIARPNIVGAWLHQLLLERINDGGLNVPAPILSRVHQLLSDGLTSYDHCKKISTTPFPFPWAQFILVLLIIFTLTCPIIIVAYTRSNWLAVMISTVSVLTYWATNEVARDIEDPFLYEPNDVPLAKSQYDYNDTLSALYWARRPLSHMDYTPIVTFGSSRALTSLAEPQGSWIGPLSQVAVVVK